MTDSRKIVWKQTGRIALGEVVGVALMYGVYALLHQLTVAVLLGGFAGAILATGNFFFMAMVATLAADRAQAQDVAGGEKLMRSSYPLRMLALGGLLVACALSGWFDILALALPLLFIRPVLMAGEFFTKKGM